MIGKEPKQYWQEQGKFMSEGSNSWFPTPTEGSSSEISPNRRQTMSPRSNHSLSADWESN
jgi:hypothetical protein